MRTVEIDEGGGDMIGNGWHRLAALAACASLVGFTACKSGNDKGTDSATTAAGDVARSDSAATAAAPAGTPSTPAPASPSSANSLTVSGGDSELVQVLAVVDQGEIEDGRLAQRQAKSSQVKAFARELVTDHSKSLQQDKQLAKTANVDLSGVLPSDKPGGNAPAGATGATGVTAQLLNAHSQMVDQLKQAQGAAFDSAFVSAQVSGHQQVLDLLKRTPGQKPEVQHHVTDAIKHVQDHLDRAQKLQQTLSTGGTTDSTSKAKSDTGRRG